jgi:hypothetical protein
MATPLTPLPAEILLNLLNSRVTSSVGLALCPEIVLPLIMNELEDKSLFNAGRLAMLPPVFFLASDE